MFYAIPDILLKVSLNTNKAERHIIRYTRHIVESVVKTPIKLASMLYVLTDTLLKASLNSNKTDQHVLRYN